MQVRDAVPPDAEGIARVSARSTRAAYEGLVEDESIIEAVESPGFADGIRDWLAETTDDGGVIYLVATAGDGGSGETDAIGEVVGFAQCYDGGERRPDDVSPDAAYLKSLYVDPDAWGEGIGTALLGAILERVDAPAVVLDVLRSNEDARGFYEARGFERERDTTVELGGAVYETARYRLER